MSRAKQAPPVVKDDIAPSAEAPVLPTARLFCQSDRSVYVSLSLADDDAANFLEVNAGRLGDGLEFKTRSAKGTHGSFHVAVELVPFLGALFAEIARRMETEGMLVVGLPGEGLAEESILVTAKTRTVEA